MFRLNQKGVIAQGLILLILVVGLGVGYYLIQDPQVFGAKIGSVALTLIPANKSGVMLGDVFDLQLQVEAGTQQLDVAEAYISFPAALLEVVDANSNVVGIQITGGTTLPTLLMNTVDNNKGMISYAAGITLGSKARPSGTFLLATVKVRAKASGTATLQIEPSSKVAYIGENIIGTRGNAVVTIGTVLYCGKTKSQYSKVLEGNELNNILRGGNGNDLIIGYGGDDNLNGGNGKDCIYGGDGNDTLGGGNNDDELYGEAGDDNLNGGNHTDTCPDTLGTNKKSSCER